MAETDVQTPIPGSFEEAYAPPVMNGDELNSLDAAFRVKDSTLTSDSTVMGVPTSEPVLASPALETETARSPSQSLFATELLAGLKNSTVPQRTVTPSVLSTANLPYQYVNTPAQQYLQSVDVQMLDGKNAFGVAEELSRRLCGTAAAPRVVVVGASGSGKSKLVEQLLNHLPIVHLGSTRSPIVYNIRRVSALPAETAASSRFHVTVQGKPDAPLEAVHVQDVVTRLRAISDHDARSGARVVGAVTVTVLTTDTSCDPISVVDLPGLVQHGEEGQKHIVHTVKQYLNAASDDIVLGVGSCRAGTSMSLLFDRRHSIDLREYDREFDRTRLVLTHVDELLKSAMATPRKSGFSLFKKKSSTTPASTTIDSLRTVISCCKRHIPELICALPCENALVVPFEQRWQLNKQETERANRDAAALMDACDFKRSLAGEFPGSRCETNISAFVPVVHQCVINQLAKRRETCLQVLQRLEDKMTARMSQLDTSRERGARTRQQLTEFVERVIGWYRCLFSGVVPGDADKRRAVRMELSGRTHSHTLADDCAAADTATVFPRSEQQPLPQEEYYKHVEAADMPTWNGSVRVERVLRDFAVRVTSIEPRVPTDEEFFALMEAASESQVASLVSQDMEALFVSGLESLFAKLLHVLQSNGRTALELLRVTPEFRSLTTDSHVVDRILQHMTDIFAEEMRRMREEVSVSLRTDGIVRDLPHMIEITPQFIEGSNSTSDKRMTREQRMKARGTLDTEETEAATRSFKPGDASYKRLQHLYARYFTASREFFCNVITACVSPRVKSLVIGNPSTTLIDRQFRERMLKRFANDMELESHYGLNKADLILEQRMAAERCDFEAVRRDMLKVATVFAKLPVGRIAK